MATEVQRGRAVLWGIGESATVEGYASILLESGKAQHKFKLDAIEDEFGNDVTLVATNAHTEVDVAFVPAADVDIAETTTVLGQVTLSGFEADALNGTYHYIGDGAIDLSHKQAKVMLKLRKYDDAGQIV